MTAEFALVVTTGIAASFGMGCLVGKFIRVGNAEPLRTPRNDALQRPYVANHQLPEDLRAAADWDNFADRGAINSHNGSVTS
jgi:hypothetical protein